jgi:23S rRNA A2030 N6-methylase RlmJ
LIFVHYVRSGGVRYDISGSTRRQIGVDCVYKYGKRQAQLAIENVQQYEPHAFIPLMRRLREMNSPDGQLPRLKSAFQYYPGAVGLIRPVMRAADRVILCEEETENQQQLEQYIKNDRRFQLHERSFTQTDFNPEFVPTISKPLTAHALVNLSIEASGMTQLDQYAQIVGKQIIQQAVRQCPHATYMVSYPIFGRNFQDDLVRDVVKTGIRHVLSATFHIQDTVSLQPPCGQLADEEPWGMGIIIANPPEHFDFYLNSLIKQCREVIESQYKDVEDQFPNGFKHKLETST